MTTTAILQWIKTNNATHIQQAIAGTQYTEDWLAGINMRETGLLIMQLLKQGHDVAYINANMRGDYSQRRDELTNGYHGYGYWQADIGSFPAFVTSGDWQDPFKACKMAIVDLEQQRASLVRHGLLGTPEQVTAAYNCGAGNVVRALGAGMDVDARTFGQDYSKSVWGYRELYRNL